MKPTSIHIHPDPAALAAAVAERLTGLTQSIIAERGAFHVALAGGSTPRRLYQLLAAPPWRDDLDWNRIRVFFGDERSVPPDHPDSNYRMARENLLDHVPIPPSRVHRMKGEARPLEQAAGEYARLLEDHLPSNDAGVPCFDLILLGLGPDGHIASLFPATDILQVRDRWVAPVYVPKLETWRLSLTLPVIDSARHVMILVAGDNKKDIVDAVLGKTAAQPQYPVQMLRPHGTLEWHLDQAAAAALQARNPEHAPKEQPAE